MYNINHEIFGLNLGYIYNCLMSHDIGKTYFSDIVDYLIMRHNHIGLHIIFVRSISCQPA